MTTGTKILLAGLLILAPALVPAQPARAAGADGDPILRYRSDVDLELDLDMIVNDLLPLILQTEPDSAKAAEAREGFQLMGLRALDRARIRSNQSLRGGVTRATITLKPGETEGLLPSLAALPPGEFRFGRFLDPDKVIAAVSFENFSAGLERVIDLMMVAENVPGWGQGFGRNPDGSISIMGVNLQRDLFPYLSGELDLILFPFRPDQDIEIPNVALVLATPDGPAFRDHLFDELTRMMGKEAATQMLGTEGEIAGAFTFYPLHEHLYYGIGPDFVVVTTDPSGMKSLVTGRASGIRAPRGRQYALVNVDRFMETVGDAMAAKVGISEEDRMLAEVFQQVGKEPVGTIELMVSSRPGTIEMELHQPGRLWNIEYRMLRQLVAHAGEIRAARERESSYRDAAGVIDRAMTAYGKDHDGLFPETPQGLVGAGYLDAFPDLTPTPLGQYLDGGYSYVPLRDEAGKVVGYYLFVYGEGEHSGYDVFTPENLADPATFRIGSDGTKDGVVSFCYDGIAIAQVEAWREGN